MGIYLLANEASRSMDRGSNASDDPLRPRSPWSNDAVASSTISASDVLAIPKDQRSGDKYEKSEGRFKAQVGDMSMEEQEGNADNGDMSMEEQEGDADDGDMSMEEQEGDADDGRPARWTTTSSNRAQFWEGVIECLANLGWGDTDIVRARCSCLPDAEDVEVVPARFEAKAIANGRGVFWSWR